MSPPQDSHDYLLGVNQKELQRLQFQHSVWKQMTEAFLDRLGVGPGWHCLDAGAGPGFVTFDLRTRVGETGMVTALEPSTIYAGHAKKRIEEEGWSNVSVNISTIESAVFPPESVDLIFLRWVLSFSGNLQTALGKLCPALRPGGVIAVQDYYYEGLSLYPHGGAWDGMADIARAYYRSAGGDLYVTGHIPGIVRSLGLTVIDFHPHQIAGGPGSPAMEWGHQYFTAHIPIMAEKGLITPEQREALLADWHAHRSNPEALYFSPIIVDVAAQRPV